MDWTQGLYIAALVAAFGFGNPHWIIVAAMVLDLATTLIFRGDYITVGAADLLVALALLFAGRRGQFVALLFALMHPIYVLGFVFKWPPAATYAIVDALAYLQLAIIGGLDVGIASARRWAANRRGNSYPGAAQMGGHAKNGVARILAEGKRE